MTEKKTPQTKKPARIVIVSVARSYDPDDTT
jgi:hypothetical protein